MSIPDPISSEAPLAAQKEDEIHSWWRPFKIIFKFENPFFYSHWSFSTCYPGELVLEPGEANVYYSSSRQSVWPISKSGSQSKTAVWKNCPYDGEEELEHNTRRNDWKHCVISLRVCKSGGEPIFMYYLAEGIWLHTTTPWSVAFQVSEWVNSLFQNM